MTARQVQSMLPPGWDVPIALYAGFSESGWQQALVSDVPLTQEQITYLKWSLRKHAKDLRKVARGL